MIDPNGSPRCSTPPPRSTASADGLYFLPHLLGERSPYWNPAARAVFAGLARHHGPAHLTRAVLEGVAFNLFTGLRAITENGIDIAAVDAIGGAANSALLLQVLADVWGVPVTRRNLVDEATAVGAAVVAGVGVGLFDDFDVARALLDRAGHPAARPGSARRLRAGIRAVHGRLPAPRAMVRSEPLTPPGSEEASRGWEGHLLSQRIISCTFCPANDRLTPGEVLLTTYAKGRTL